MAFIKRAFPFVLAAVVGMVLIRKVAIVQTWAAKVGL